MPKTTYQIRKERLTIHEWGNSWDRVASSDNDVYTTEKAALAVLETLNPSQGYRYTLGRVTCSKACYSYETLRIK